MSALTVRVRSGDYLVWLAPVSGVIVSRPDGSVASEPARLAVLEELAGRQVSAVLRHRREERRLRGRPPDRARSGH